MISTTIPETTSFREERLRHWCGRSAWLGAVVWLAHATAMGFNPFETQWAVELLLLAPLVLVPLALRLIVGEVMDDGVAGRAMQAAVWLQLPSALLLAAAFHLEQGPAAAVLAVPWLLVTLCLAAAGAGRLVRGALVWNETSPLDVGLVLVVVAGVWGVLFRLGWWPLGFEPIIVLLTAIHFHYAALLLPVLTALAASRLPGRFSRWAGGMVSIGVPCLAVGITATHLGFPPLIEVAAALLMSAGGACVGLLYCRLAVMPGESAFSRGLWGLAGAVLMAGMVLSTLYGLRFFDVLPGLDIPWMRALHGTGNALGFALPALMAWTQAHLTSPGQSQRVQS